MTARSRARLSVCMIVRDEERVLDRCLASIQGLHDELCIVDTGSVDATPAIAARHGARFARIDACNDEAGRMVDFALARNAALALATGDWVLQVDADEVLVDGASRVRGWVDGAGVGGPGDEARAADSVAVRLRSGQGEWASVRLFRRTAARGYRSRIHEYVECSGRTVADSGIVIANLQAKEGKEGASERNRRIGELMLAEDPDDARALFYLAGENRRAGRLREAAGQYARCLALGTFRPGLYRATFQLGACHLMLGDWVAAMDAARRAIALDPRYAEGHCLLADALCCAGRQDEARTHYQAALACEPPHDAMFPLERWAYGPHPRQQLEAMSATVVAAEAAAPASDERFAPPQET